MAPGSGGIASHAGAGIGTHGPPSGLAPPVPVPVEPPVPVDPPVPVVVAVVLALPPVPTSLPVVVLLVDAVSLVGAPAISLLLSPHWMSRADEKAETKTA
jgi:hypothetical protein